MKKTPIFPDLNQFPSQFHPFLQDASIYDSSCSAQARVYFIDKGPGYFLKTAPKGSLVKEAAMTRYFHSKGLGAEVLAYESLDADWMLTVQVPGADCVEAMYLEDPVRLCDTTAHILRQLHELPADDCPICRLAEYRKTAEVNYVNRKYDMSLFPDNWGYRSPEEAWEMIDLHGHELQADCLLHGDYCLPNILLNNWAFSSFIDLDSGGLGDRHIDLFWGIWSLQFNLKTDRYADRFLDAYGRDKVHSDLFPVIAAFEVFQ